MTWVKLDDGFASHPKTIAAGPHGVALFVTSLCWVARNLTDGRIPKHVLPALAAEAGVKKAVADTLVAVGYWHDRGDHWEINGYLERNPSRQKVENDRARWRGYKRGSTAESHVESNGDSTADSAHSRPDPSRRDLQPPTTESRLAALNGRAEEVLAALLAAERSRSGRVQNRPAWNRTVAARLNAEHGERIARLTAEYPDAPAEVIASQIAGESTNLRYFTRSDPA
jgi:hypothetical protein